MFCACLSQGWVVAGDGIVSQQTIVRGLRPDTAYMFLVRAQNSHGLSQPSPVTAPIRTTGGNGIRPTLPPLDIGLVSEKLTGKVVEMKDPEVFSSTDIKINWEVRDHQSSYLLPQMSALLILSR